MGTEFAEVRSRVWKVHSGRLLRKGDPLVRYVVLILALMLFASPVAADPLPEGGVLVAAARKTTGRKPAPGKVVITGKGGKVTGVVQQPGERKKKDRKKQK